MDILEFADVGEWESWLDAHHDSEPGAWLRIAKRGSGLNRLAIEDALDGALCFGWIDGQRKGLDGVSFVQRYSPRRRTSSWSQINVAKFEALAASGRVRPAGFAQVAAAKADGRWDAAYESQRTASVPPDLQAALAADPRAAAVFEGLDRTARYALILKLLKTTTPQRRAIALARAVVELAADPRTSREAPGDVARS